MASGFNQPLAIASGDGPAVTGTGGATCLPGTAKYIFPPNAFGLGTTLWIHAFGRISNVVTTPGTARLDVRLGSTVVFDTGALTLNAVAKTTLPWEFYAKLTCRAVGASGNFFGFGKFQSESIVGSPLASAGGSGSLLSAAAAGPETPPAVGANVDLTVSNALDFFYTQTVATGSFTVHTFEIWSYDVAR